MAGQFDLSMPRVYDLDPADASLTGFASNVTGASWPLTATSSGDGLAHQVSIRNDSANDKSSIDIVLVGTDQNGNAQTETLTGPTGSATVESTLYYLTLTSVTPASTWGADTADIGWVDEFITPTINLNWGAEDCAALVVDVTGTINFTLQQTFDRLDGALTPLWQTVPEAGSKTVDGVYNTTGGATGARLVVNSYSSGAEIRFNVNQTFISNSEGNGGGGGGGGGGGDVNLTELAGTALIETVAGALDVVILDGAGSPITYNANGQATMANSSPVVIASNQSAVPISNTALTNIGAGDYETVAASQTDQMLGPTGAAGDYLSGLLIIPATTSPGAVSIEDGSTNMVIFAGGASSVSNLVPFFIPLGIVSVSGGWEVTTGANVSVFAVGNFT